MEKIIRCPVDEHLCQRKECPRNRDFPQCEEAIAQIADMTITMDTLMGLIDTDNENYNKYLAYFKALTAYTASQLKVDLSLFSRRIQDQIESNLSDRES